MKKSIIILISFLTSSFLFAQDKVWDIAKMEMLIEQHKNQYDGLKSMKEQEAQLLIINRQIKSKLDELKEIEEKTYKALKNVEIILRNAKDIIHIYELSEDIVKYQSQMLQYAADNPMLAVIAAKTELELINKTLILMDYVYTAINDDDTNLMDNSQRMNLLQTIIRDLREMRGMAFSICRQMKIAKRDGILQALAPQMYGYPSDGRKIKEEILKNYNPGRKK